MGGSGNNFLLCVVRIFMLHFLLTELVFYVQRVCMADWLCNVTY